MDVSFSEINMEYFIAARDVANENINTASIMLGISPELMQSIAALTPRQLANMALVDMPLIIPRDEKTWWPRFIRALQDGNKTEMQTLAEQTNYYFSGEQTGG